MDAWRHRLNGHEFEQTLGNGEGRGSLECYSPWVHKEWDTTEVTEHQPHHKSSSAGPPRQGLDNPIPCR